MGSDDYERGCWEVGSPNDSRLCPGRDDHFDGPYIGLHESISGDGKQYDNTRRNPLVLHSFQTVSTIAQAPCSPFAKALTLRAPLCIVEEDDGDAMFVRI